MNYVPLLIPFLCVQGEIIGFASSGYLTTTPRVDMGALTVGGWDTVFYLFGSLGMLWWPMWHYCAHERPEDHPTISAEELEFITRGGVG